MRTVRERSSKSDRGRCSRGSSGRFSPAARTARSTSTRGALTPARHFTGASRGFSRPGTKCIWRRSGALSAAARSTGTAPPRLRDRHLRDKLRQALSPGRRRCGVAASERGAGVPVSRAQPAAAAPQGDQGAVARGIPRTSSRRPPRRTRPGRRRRRKPTLPSCSRWSAPAPRWPRRRGCPRRISVSHLSKVNPNFEEDPFPCGLRGPVAADTAQDSTPVPRPHPPPEIEDSCEFLAGGSAAPPSGALPEAGNWFRTPRTPRDASCRRGGEDRLPGRSAAAGDGAGGRSRHRLRQAG